MNDGFSKEPIVGEDAAKMRQMLHEWRQFKNSDMEILRKVSWGLRNWKFIGLVAIMGAAGQFSKLLETLKAWLQ